MQPAAIWPRERHPVLRLKLPALDGAHDYSLVMIMSVCISCHLCYLSILAFCAVVAAGNVGGRRTVSCVACVDDAASSM
jgi:hypothetical protein